MSDTENGKIRAAFLESWRPYPWLVLLALAAYVRTIGFDFSPLDDQWLILHRLDRLRDLSSWPSLLTRPMFENAYYRPMLALSFAFDAIVGDGNPAVFHATNVLLHAAVSVLVFRFLVRLETERLPAFLAAALFAVHPVHVHAVAWIPGRNDLLLAVFSLLAAIAFDEYLCSSGVRSFALLLLFVLLGLLTKESAVVLPFVLLGYGLLTGKSRSRLWPPATGFVVVLAGWWILRSRIVSDLPSVEGWNAGEVVGELASAFVIYCGKLVLPVQQAVFPSTDDSSLLPGLLAIVSTSVAIGALGLKNKRRALFGSLWFVAFLALPLLHGSTGVAGEHYEHRLYLPAVGFLILLLQIDWRARRAGPIYLSAILLVTAVFLGKTVHRSSTYRNPVTLSTAGVEESPGSAFARTIRGRVLAGAGDLQAAIADFEWAIERIPARTTLRAEVHAELGTALLETGKTVDAIRHYEQALALRPGDAAVHNNLGVALARRGRSEEAARHFAEALRIRPDYPGAKRNLDRVRGAGGHE